MASMELPANGNLFTSQRDALYNYDEAAHKAITSQRPWRDYPTYFKMVRISAVALVKMVTHARSGGSLEVMGLMQGFVEAGALVITDAFRLPVEGTETRVNAQDDANAYLVEYLELCRREGRQENVVGWYHSHPGYGCWLSGIDVSTQQLQQKFQDPFVAVVIDPDRTISANKVEIGAFRTYPEDYKPSSSAAGGPDGYQMVPLNKAEDFGAHSSKYYPLEVEHFKSTLDSKLLESLWNKYWVQTLSQNPVLSNRDYSTNQMLDLGNKIKEANSVVQHYGRSSQVGGSGSKTVDGAVGKVVHDTKRIAGKEATSLMAEEVKAKLFSSSTPPTA